ncbi:MAG: chemotaxis protein CheW [Acidobacteriaceae bacterium]
MTPKDIPDKITSNRTHTGQFATFRVADMFMGIELCRVQELMRYQEMAPVPLAPSTVEGLINLRGQIVTALDMRRLFSLPPMDAADRLRMNIVIRSEGGAVSLLVDEICDVLDVPQETWTQLPENLPAAQRTFLQGVYQLESTLLMIVDTERVLSIGSD